jgi:hypothetical protein
VRRIKGEKNNGQWSVEAKARRVAAGLVCGFSLRVRKSLKVFKKGMLSLDLVWIWSGLSLDLVETVEGHEPAASGALKAKARRLAGSVWFCLLI